MMGIINRTKRWAESLKAKFNDNDGLCEQPFCFNMATNRANMLIESQSEITNTINVDGCNNHIGELVKRKTKDLEESYTIKETTISRINS